MPLQAAEWPKHVRRLDVRRLNLSVHVREGLRAMFLAASIKDI
jgi:hypothetical protein